MSEARRVLHNVVDRRRGWVGSVEVEGPLVYEALGSGHVGRTVVYCDIGGRAEAGTISSWSHGFVFVLYTSGNTPAATKAEDLWLASEALCGEVIDADD